MLKIIVASTNPVKINAAQLGFASMFPHEEFEVQGVSAQSGVSDQPVGDEETLAGAVNRVTAAREMGEADYYLSVEGGIEYVNDEVQVFAWIVVSDRTGKTSKGRTGVFLLPKKIVEYLRAGDELGTAVDKVFDEKNSKQKGGSVGILTGNTIDRTAYYHHAIILALVPFKNPELY